MVCFNRNLREYRIPRVDRLALAGIRRAGIASSTVATSQPSRPVLRLQYRDAITTKGKT
jgi:hypothetical protein